MSVNTRSESTNNCYQRMKKNSNHTLWAKSAQLLFKLKFITRNKPFINWGGCGRLALYATPCIYYVNPYLVTPVNIRYKPCCIKSVLQLRSRDKDVNTIRIKYIHLIKPLKPEDSLLTLVETSQH